MGLRYSYTPPSCICIASRVARSTRRYAVEASSKQIARPWKLISRDTTYLVNLPSLRFCLPSLRQFSVNTRYDQLAKAILKVD